MHCPLKAPFATWGHSRRRISHPKVLKPVIDPDHLWYWLYKELSADVMIISCLQAMWSCLRGCSLPSSTAAANMSSLEVRAHNKLADRMRDRCKCELVVCSEQAGGDRAGVGVMARMKRPVVASHFERSVRPAVGPSRYKYWSDSWPRWAVRWTIPTRYGLAGPSDGNRVIAARRVAPFGLSRGLRIKGLFVCCSHGNSPLGM